MISSKTLLKHLKQLGNDEELIISGNQYKLSQIRLAEKIVEDLEKEIHQTSRKPKLSRRRAFMVILEELYYDSFKYPEELTLDTIHRRASQRFEYMNRDSRSFNTPTQIHPKKPCDYYEDNPHGKARYRSALLHLVNESGRYFELVEAEESLKIIYDEVLLC